MAEVEKLDSAEETRFMPGTAGRRLSNAATMRGGSVPDTLRQATHKTVINSGTQQMGSMR